MTENNRSLFVKNSQMLSANENPAVQQLLSLGNRNGWGFHILGYADLPKEPVRLEKWLIIPAQEDNSPIPQRTLERIQSIFAAGLRPQGFVIVHEAPRTLPAPKKIHTSFSLPALAAKKPDTPTSVKPAAHSRSSSLSSLMEILASILGVFSTIIFPVMFVGLLALDPIVIAVMDDGCWIEIDRWYVQ